MHGIVTAIILSGGKELSQKFRLIRIEVSRAVNRIPTAELVLLDGDPAARRFELSDGAFFEPGKEVEIRLRYEGGRKKAATVFKGLVLRQNLEADGMNSTLTLELKDAAWKMTRGRRSAVFRDKSDLDIIKELIKDSGVRAGKMPAKLPVLEEMVQYYCSNWDFMLLRAEANNLLVVVENGEVSLKEVAMRGSPRHTFEYGISTLFQFEMEADASHQYATAESVSWDIKTQKLAQKSTAADFPLAQGNLDGKKIAGKLGGKEQLLSSMVPLAPEEQQNWADGNMMRTRMSMIRGTISVPGIEDISLLDVMEIKSIGKRFNGKTLVTGIRHTVDEEGWQTHLQFGLSHRPFAEVFEVADEPAAGLLPAVDGLQVGVIDGFEEDKSTREFRVRVILPGISPQKGSVWARLASPEAGKGRGFFFRPEKGDEVVVGFFNNDPRQAVILGALFSSKNKPPQGWEKLNAENAHRGIVSKSGMAIAFDDEAQTLSLLTSENNSVVLDEKNKTIVIKGLNGNTITLNDAGISIKAVDKLSLEADGDIEINGSNITLDARGNVEIKGSQVDVK